MLYGVTINGTNTLTQYGLILLADLKISDPELKEEYVDIPGADGSLDFSEAPQGRPTFKDRQISFNLFKAVDDVALETLRNALMTAYHGRVVRLGLPTDADHYFEGRLQIGGLIGYNSGKIPVKVKAAPYRLKKTLTTVTKSITGSGTVTLTNEAKPVAPIISTTAPITIAWTKDGTSHSVSIGAGDDQIIPSLQLEAGSLTLTITGTASVTFEYREGRL